MNNLIVRILAVQEEAAHVISLKLAPADSAQSLPPAEAGAHIDLHLSSDLIRSYSLCLPSDGKSYNIAVHRVPDSRGGSQHVHEKLRVGDELLISTPRNHFPLRAHEGPAILVAGGIGITPLHAMLVARRLQRQETHLIYCARSRNFAAFMSSIAQHQGDDMTVHYHFDDEMGAPPDLLALLRPYGSVAHYYACGPAAMLDRFQAVCSELHYPLAYLERFSASSVATQPFRLAPYEVELARSGVTLLADPDVPLLDSVQAAGVFIPYSCQEGVCGSCETRVLSGDIDHRDSILTEEEKRLNGVMMPCVSHCKSGKLVLDL